MFVIVWWTVVIERSNNYKWSSLGKFPLKLKSATAITSCTIFQYWILFAPSSWDSTFDWVMSPNCRSLVYISTMNNYRFPNSRMLNSMVYSENNAVCITLKYLQLLTHPPPPPSRARGILLNVIKVSSPQFLALSWYIYLCSSQVAWKSV